jgi:hypothetical protein
MAFAKPVIGTKVPAPATLATLSNTPIPVKRQVKKIIIIVAVVREVSSLKPIKEKRENKNSAKVHIVPPIANEKKASLIIGDFGDLCTV